MHEILVGLDRDDTINVNPDEDFGKQSNWKDLLQICPTVIEGVRLLNRYGCMVVVASNQSGIARGIFPYERQQEINLTLTQILESHGARIHSWNYCPFYSRTYAASKGYMDCSNPWILEDDDPRLSLRKPGIGMLEKGAADLGMALLDFKNVAFIGDKITDVYTGLNADGIGIMIDMGDKNLADRRQLDPLDRRQKLAQNFYHGCEIVIDEFCR